MDVLNLKMQTKVTVITLEKITYFGDDFDFPQTLKWIVVTIVNTLKIFLINSKKYPYNFFFEFSDVHNQFCMILHGQG